MNKKKCSFREILKGLRMTGLPDWTNLKTLNHSQPPRAANKQDFPIGAGADGSGAWLEKMSKYYSQICQIGLFFILLKTLKRYIYGVGQGGISSLKTRKKDQKDRVPAAKMNKFLIFSFSFPLVAKRSTWRA